MIWHSNHTLRTYVLLATRNTASGLQVHQRKYSFPNKLSSGNYIIKNGVITMNLKVYKTIEFVNGCKGRFSLF